VIHWLRPRSAADDDLEARHLPLSGAHFFLKRCGEQALTPLLVLCLSLPFWAAVLLYIQLPYGHSLLRANGDHNPLNPYNSWLLQTFWTTLSFAGAVLLPLAAGFTLTELGAPQCSSALAGMARSAVLLLTMGGTYWTVKHIDDEFLMGSYYQSVGVKWEHLVLPVVLLLVFAFAAGLLKRRLRGAAFACFVAVVATGILVPQMPDNTGVATRRFIADHKLIEIKYAGGYALGHLSPTNNVRLLSEKMDYHIVLGWNGPPSPEYPDYEYMLEADYQRAVSEYEEQYRVYHQGFLAARRIRLPVGATLYPLVLSLLVTGGLFTGFLVRPQPMREED
jgi:hypothetical protein